MEGGAGSEESIEVEGQSGMEYNYSGVKDKPSISLPSSLNSSLSLVDLKCRGLEWATSWGLSKDAVRDALFEENRFPLVPGWIKWGLLYRFQKQELGKGLMKDRTLDSKGHQKPWWQWSHIAFPGPSVCICFPLLSPYNLAISAPLGTQRRVATTKWHHYTLNLYHLQMRCSSLWLPNHQGRGSIVLSCAGTLRRTVNSSLLFGWQDLTCRLCSASDGCAVLDKSLHHWNL